MNPRTKNLIMKIIKSFPSAIIALSLSNCGSSGKVVEVEKSSGFQASHGPFDSKGNYIESWADNTPKRKYVRTKSPAKKASTPKPTYTPKKTVTKSTYTTKPTYTPKKAVTKSTYTPKPSYTPKKTTKTTTPTKRSTAKKITPKSKPPIIHTVAKGDTLYGLARKYGASVSAIQTTNSLSSTSISIGRRLIIPRK